MFAPRTISTSLEIVARRFCVAVLVVGLSFVAGGCKTSAHSSDSRLRKIDEMLETELPKGSSMARVNFFLSERGYRIENAGKPQTIVTIVRQIDTETLRPASARVTFHFDAKDQLDSYEMVAAPDEWPHP